MSGWTDRLAGALSVPPIDDDIEARMLDASRDVAHRVERKEAPLSSFLLGVAVGRSMAAGTSLEDAIDRTFEVLARTLPDQPSNGA